MVLQWVWERFRNYIIERKFHSLFILFKFQTLKANIAMKFLFFNRKWKFSDEIQTTVLFILYILHTVGRHICIWS